MPAGGAVDEPGVGSSHCHVDRHRVIGLVLYDNGKLETIAEVKKARSAGSHHQGTTGGDGRLAGAKSLGSVNGDSLDSIALEIVRQSHLHLRAAIRGSSDSRRKGCQGGKVFTQRDLWFLAAGFEKAEIDTVQHEVVYLAC